MAARETTVGRSGSRVQGDVWSLSSGEDHWRDVDDLDAGEVDRRSTTSLVLKPRSRTASGASVARHTPVPSASPRSSDGSVERNSAQSRNSSATTVCEVEGEAEDEDKD